MKHYFQDKQNKWNYLQVLLHTSSFEDPEMFTCLRIHTLLGTRIRSWAIFLLLIKLFGYLSFQRCVSYSLFYFLCGYIRLIADPVE